MSLRVLIVVTHLLGAGHLTRAAALARAFAEAGHETVLVSGGASAQVLLDTVRMVQLPPVRTIGTDFRTLLDEAGRPVSGAYLDQRRDLLLQTLNAVRPHVLITELFPFGRRALADEFMALLEAARVMTPRPQIASSIRDILVAPSKPERVAETHRRLMHLYDAVLVHGDPELVALDASWPVSGVLRPLLHYTGYVDEGVDPVGSKERHGIVVSGGSSAAGIPLYRAAMAAAHIVDDRPWRLLIGRGVSEEDVERLMKDAPPHVSVERTRPDFRMLLASAELSISQAGYNTCVDLLRTSVRQILVPFEAGRETEQRLRADRLQAMGLARVVPEEDITGAKIADAVRNSLAAPYPQPLSLGFDGARRSVAIVESLILAAPQHHARLDWSPLSDALHRARDRGCPIRFWWRDDDAVARTPQLDRLLALAGRYQAGLGIACVPAGLEPSLAKSLRGAEGAFALVHGSSHANHAPHGEKKAEFGAHRPVTEMAKEVAEGLGRSAAMLGDRLLPVFVPPWNRITPTLVENLPQAGYRAISIFKDRTTARTAEGLAIVNTHVDPIDWHGSRSLSDPLGLIRNLTDAVERRVSGAADPEEPIGFLTHHLVHDEKVWTFCENLLVYLSRNNESFVAIDELFCNKNRIVVDT
ncbi:glycosyltransferase [Microvirga puerhi]|uniref:Glycosyl transferase family 28 n=1 Tax=Microvirga puerhi TaxID=2876078 RepID=A0ABS7VL94_9HYPH|nr:glycosyltransferase [Microvirga puerhi]MBZ6076309.1 glycosyl transferase family 28 [Microvirga puerhi]